MSGLGKWRHDQPTGERVKGPGFEIDFTVNEPQSVKWSGPCLERVGSGTQTGPHLPGWKPGPAADQLPDLGQLPSAPGRGG